MAEPPSTLCDEGYVLASSIVMKVLLPVRMAVSVVGTVLMLLLMRFCHQAMVFHPNALLLFNVHFVWNVYFLLVYFLIHLLDLIRLCQTGIPPCGYVIGVPLSFHLRCAGIIAIAGQQYSLLSIAVERVVASVALRTYEASTDRKLAFLLIFLQIAVSTLPCYALLAPGVDWTGYAIAFSARTAENAERYQFVIVTEAIPEVFVIVLFHGTLAANNLRRRMFESSGRKEFTVGGLSVRYQLNETQRALKTLIPMIWSHFFFFIITITGLLVFPLIYGNASLSTHTIYLDCVHVSPLYCIVLPFVTVVTSERYRNDWRMFFGLGKQRSVVSDVALKLKGNEADIYFSQFDTAMSSKEAASGPDPVTCATVVSSFCCYSKV